MTRAELTAATLRAHLDYKGGSWIADCEGRAEAVSGPGWREIERLQAEIEALQAGRKIYKRKPTKRMTP